MKISSRHVVAFLLLVALSIGFGFSFDATATAIEKHKYPRPESLDRKVAAFADEYGLPQSIIWATLRCGSAFASNAVSEDGKVGLMQLTSARFDHIRTELLGLEAMDAGMLYDPDTNLSSGCAWLSYLYEYYGVWDLVFAAYHTGTETVDGWLSNSDLVDENGILIEIPDRTVAAYVRDMTKAVK